MTSEPDLTTYLKLFKPYEEQLKSFNGREREYGGRFALLFRQIVRLLILPHSFNDRIPALYLSIAKRYLNGDKDTVGHFSYEDNRHYFLSELLEWLKIHERGENIRNTGVK